MHHVSHTHVISTLALRTECFGVSLNNRSSYSPHSIRKRRRNSSLCIYNIAGREFLRLVPRDTVLLVLTSVWR